MPPYPKNFYKPNKESLLSFIVSDEKLCQNNMAERNKEASRLFWHKLSVPSRRGYNTFQSYFRKNTRM